ncbi:MAG: glycoside hydrolase family 28 protein [Myxococcota bacterium]
MSNRLTRGWALILVSIGCSQAQPEPRAVRPESRVSVDPIPAELETIEPIRAPFAMPNLERPRFPPRSVDLRAFGAVADGVTPNTEAFRLAIAELARDGGGSLEVPAGVWLSGPIHLVSNIRLHLQRDARIRFSQNFADYLPPVLTRWEGIEVYNFSPLIYARDAENVAITGEGTLDGQGSAWWPWKQTQKAVAERLYQLAADDVPVEKRVLAQEGGLRPSFIQTFGCKNVLVEGVTIQNGPMWTIHPVYSENVIVRRVRVETEGPNNDGCNPDSSRNVLIEDSHFSTGDDCIVIKSGLNEDGWRVGKPSENVVVRRVHGERGHGGVVIGSEMSGGVRNVYAHDCEFVGTDRGLRIKSMRGRGGWVESIYYEGVRHRDIRLQVVEVTSAYGSSTLVPRSQTPPLIRDVSVRNISANAAGRALEIIGLPELPVADVSFEGVSITAREGARCQHCRNVRFHETHIDALVPPRFAIENGQEIRLFQSCGAEPNCLRASSDSSVFLGDDSKAPM